MSSSPARCAESQQKLCPEWGEAVRRLLVDLGATFRYAGVDYCVMGSRDRLPDVRETDVDLLVGREQLGVAIQLVENCARGWGGEVAERFATFGLNSLFLTLPGFDRMIRFDLFSGIHWGPFEIGDGQVLRSTSCDDGFMRFAHPGLYGVVWTLKSLIRGQQLRAAQVSVWPQVQKVCLSGAAVPLVGRKLVSALSERKSGTRLPLTRLRVAVLLRNLRDLGAFCRRAEAWLVARYRQRQAALGRVLEVYVDPTYATALAERVGRYLCKPTSATFCSSGGASRRLKDTLAYAGIVLLIHDHDNAAACQRCRSVLTKSGTWNLAPSVGEVRHGTNVCPSCTVDAMAGVIAREIVERAGSGKSRSEPQRGIGEP